MYRGFYGIFLMCLSEFSHGTALVMASPHGVGACAMRAILLPTFLVTSILLFGVIVAKITEAKFARIATRSVRNK
jgi:hypothetical protein